MRMKKFISALLVITMVFMTVTGAFAASGSLRLHDTGAAVRELQQMLSQLGYTVAVDGVFGSGTEAAVRAFQSANSLTVDGIAGSATLTLLRSMTGAGSTTKPGGSVNGLFDGDYSTMRPKESSGRVRVLQKALNMLGYNAGNEDAVYGKGTEAAVRWFQQVQGLTADGKAGEKTLKRIESFFNADGTVRSDYTPPTAAVAPATTAPDASGTGLFGGNYAKMVRGEVSSRVRVLQTALNALGYSVGTADAVYGSGTEAAVRLFQVMQGLTADGKAGEKTLKRIESFFNADGTVRSDYTPPANLPTATPTTAPGSGTMPTRTLRPGDSGEDVRSLQTRLKELGYYAGAIDGQYGSGTTSAVFQFQINNGLYADGKAGPDTNTRLFSDSAIAVNATTSTPQPTETTAPTTAVPTTEPTASPSPTPQNTVPSRTLSQGSTGDDVRSVQSRLQELGYYNGVLDGVYGSGTVAAVTAFQQANNLDADGKAGAATYAILFSDKAIPAAGQGSTSTDTPTSAPTAVPSTNVTLRKGDTGDVVVQLQKALLNLGYTVNTNGTYTNETVTAVKLFQSANGLNVDGIAGSSTLNKLYSGTAAGPDAATDGPGTTTAGVMSNPPSNSQIQLLHWYKDIKPKLSGRPIVQIYDPASGLTWNIQIFSMGQHADGEPPTLQDTQIMYKAFGNQFTWNEKPVFVKLPSGVWCIASMHDRPHEGDMIPPSVNGFAGTFKGVYEKGHLCIHFPRDMAETEKNAPKNGVRHQNDIRKKWKEMTGQDIPW